MGLQPWQSMMHKERIGYRRNIGGQGMSERQAGNGLPFPYFRFSFAHKSCTCNYYSTYGMIKDKISNTGGRLPRLSG